MSFDQTYSKKDISKILTKASEIQTKKDLYEDPEGLTEAELVHIAEEVGISEETLKEALLSYDSTSLSDTFNWLKGTGKIQHSSFISGRMNDEKWDDVVQKIRSITGGIGKISKVGNSYEWEQRRKEIGYRHLSIKSKNGKTSVHYVYNWWGIKLYSMAIPFILFVVITSIALDGSNFSDIGSLLIAMSGGLVGLPFGRIYLRRYFEKQKKQVQSLFSGINKVVKNSTDKPSIKIEEDGIYSEKAPSTTRSNYTKNSLY